MESLHIKYEDSEILLVCKPAGIATQSCRIGEKDMVSMVKNYRAKKGEPPYAALIHRLDQPVGGLLLFAKTKGAAANLSAQIQTGTMEKYYQALLCGIIEEEGRLTDYLIKDKRANLSHVIEEGTPGAKRASLEFRRLRSFSEETGGKCLEGIRANASEMADSKGSPAGPVSLVEIKLETGRHHQIRVQMAHHGFPLLGDRKYGKSDRGQKLALFAWKLKFRHPKSGEWMEFTEEAGFL